MLQLARGQDLKTYLGLGVDGIEQQRVVQRFRNAQARQFYWQNPPGSPDK
jgi:hypothetical protein